MRPVFLLTALVTYSFADATVIVSNITGNIGNGGATVCGSCGGPDSLAQQFISNGSFVLDSAEVVVDNILYTNPSADFFNVWIARDASGLPGSLIEQIGFGVSASGLGGEVVANSIATPVVLAPGVAYWLVLTPANPNTEVPWDRGGASSFPQAGVHSADGTGTWFSNGSDIGQMEIDGTAVPEPTSFVFVLSGILAALIGFSSFRRYLRSVLLSPLPTKLSWTMRYTSGEKGRAPSVTLSRSSARNSRYTCRSCPTLTASPARPFSFTATNTETHRIR